MKVSPTRHIGFFVFPGFSLLDLSGPLEAFQVAQELARGSYRLSVVSLQGGALRCSSGLQVATGRATRRQAFDTFIVVGGPGVDAGCAEPDTVERVRVLAGAARRAASICTGAFLLAATGLLDARAATTHWRYAAQLQGLHPLVRVDGDRIWVRDGPCWTSAGVTSGIDLGLALIEDDLGKDLSLAVARLLVVHHRRAGGQHQHAALLDIEPGSERIRHVLAFAREHIAQPLPVERLAAEAHLSLRQFSRSFAAQTGMTPAKAIEKLRAELARPMVEDSREALKEIARKVGFADLNRMRLCFVRLFGVSPQSMRRQARLA